MDIHTQMLEDQRRFQRVECCLVPTEGESLPVWIFTPGAGQGERGGVVLDISSGGLQILTTAAPPLTGDRFELHLLPADDDAETPPFSGHVRRIWSRHLGSQAQVGGFEFAAPNDLADTVLEAQSHQVAARQWVRCLLVAQ